MTTKIDPIRENCFKPYQLAESISSRLFYVTAVMSLLSLFVPKQDYPLANEILQIATLLAAIGLFILGLAIRLYFMPRAESQRLSDFFGRGFDVDLGGHRTQHYYNNELQKPVHRLAAQVLENALFSKEITRRMCHAERWHATLYFSVLLGCIVFKRSEYEFMIIVVQIVLSENLFSKFIRLEWLRGKCEDTYKAAWELLSAPPSTAAMNARTLEVIATYETAKANAGILLDEKVFEEMNPVLTKAWHEQCLRLNIQQAP